MGRVGRVACPSRASEAAGMQRGCSVEKMAGRVVGRKEGTYHGPMDTGRGSGGGDGLGGFGSGVDRLVAGFEVEEEGQE